ncbi:uncharacterized protein [Temnothorax nylanderi]|uniref:uncharacterized protein n=1 Tax=Temnothorax nylanderi TaxID=102681 RepID=UPI003A88BD75
MRKESCRCSKKTPGTAYAMCLGCLVSRDTKCTVFYVGTDSIRIIIREYSNFFREIKNSASIFVKCRRNNFFPDRILWTDEATFTPNGVFNTRNYLYWAEENPHVVRDRAFQYCWAINVWAGITADRIIGPYFLPPRLNGEIYRNFLQNELPALLEDIPLHARAEIIFQHDGAPAHFSRQVREFLNAHYPDRWVGRGGPIIWPPRSPDLNVLDYFVWGHIKAVIEHRRDGTEAEVREAILAAFNTITPEMAYRATRNITRRAELCLQERGRHFEQLLH